MTPLISAYTVKWSELAEISLDSDTRISGHNPGPGAAFARDVKSSNQKSDSDDL